MIATMPPVSEAAISKNFMYATMRPPPPPRSSGNAGNAVVNAIDLFPDFVPPPPPMFEGPAGLGVGPPGVMKPPVPPGKPDKMKCVVGQAKPPGTKGEKKRESTV